MENKRISIDVLDLTIRCQNFLNYIVILFIDELENKTAHEILDFSGCGLKTLREIRKELAKYGTCLKDDYIANTENEKKFIENIPILIRDIQIEVGDLSKKINWLYTQLDKLHLDMQPKKRKLS